jgi:AcrR family transcriptional regulator
LTSRREQKKQETFDSIVSVAARSFQESGYHASTIEVVAAKAGVSAGTVYNYFGTKSAILMAVVTRDSEHAFADASEATDLSSGDPIEVLMPMVMLYVDATTTLGRDVLKDLFRAGFDPAESALMAELISLDERALMQIAETLARMKNRDMVAEEVDAMPAAMLVYSVIAAAILVFVSVPTTTVQDVEMMVRTQLTLVFQGIGVG